MKWPRIFMVLGFSFLLATVAPAEEKSWVGGVDNSWSNAANWDPTGVPQNGDDVFLLDGITGINYDYADPLVLKSLEIWGGQILPLGSGYALETTDRQVVGVLGKASFWQRGTNTVGTDLYVGWENGITETSDYTMSGGTLNVKQNLLVGVHGRGWFNQSAPPGSASTIVDVKGMLVVDNVSDLPGGGAKYTLDQYEQGANALTVHGNEYIGRDGRGEFQQEGGTHQCDGLLTLGQYTGSWGNYSLGKGDLTVQNMIIGQKGRGMLYNGWKHTVNQDLVIAGAQGGYGQYDIILSRAVLTVGNDFSVGQYALGTINHTYGSVAVNNELRVGDKAIGTGNYFLGKDTSRGYGKPAPGVLEVFREYIGFEGTGYFLQANGDNLVSGDMSLGHNQGGNGTYDLNERPCTGPERFCSPVKLEVGGYLRVGNAGTGTFNQSSGDVYVGASGGEGLTVQYEPPAVSETAQAMAQQLVSSYNMTGGTLTVGQIEHDGNGVEISFTPAPIINNGLFNIHDGGTEEKPILVRGDVTNNNEFQVANANVKFDGTFTNNGAFHSDPSTMHFTNLYIGAEGYLAGEAGDAYKLSGSFKNESTQNVLWQTRNAQLIFEDAEQAHQLLVNSRDDGAVMTAYDDNFAWGTVDFGGDDSEAEFLSGSLALYTGSLLGVVIDADGKVVNLSGDSNVYYIFDPTNPGANGYLNGQTYAFLSGKGQVIPVVTPEPAAILLYGMGGLPLAARFLRRRKGVRG